MRQDHLNKVLSISSESAKIQQKAIELAKEHILDAARMIELAIESGNKLLICGNGGSAADAQHLAGEFINRFRRERAAYPAIALTTDTSILTSLGNDYSYDVVFSRQCESLVEDGDVVIGISTSGNSKNVELGLIAAKQRGAKTIGLLGNNGGIIKSISDISIIVDSNDTANIQESHRVIYHIICDLVEKQLSEIK